jgi:hypothetical protein
MVATYEGKLHWSDHSLPFPAALGDDDYNWDLYPKNCSGLTAQNPDAIHLEFDSDETVDNISDGWWNQFHSMVDEGDASARQLIGETGNGLPDAIVIGLMGLDAEHGGGSELHPVYVMAIHLQDDPNNDQWAILARNWGDEGECSHGKEVVEINSLSLLIPRANASSVSVLDSTRFYSNGNSTVSYTQVPGGVLVTFNLGPPQDENLISGLLQLLWTFPPGAPAGVARASAAPVKTAPGLGPSATSSTAVHRQTRPLVNEESENGAEGIVDLLVFNLPKAQRQQFTKLAMPPRFRTMKPVQLVQRPLPQKQTTSPKVSSVPDARKEQRNLMRLQMLCKAYNGKIPGLPANTCTGH